MFERHGGGDRAVLVSLMNGEPEAVEATVELGELARSAGGALRCRDPRTQPAARLRTTSPPSTRSR
ncbi:MAG: hypothetical protein ABI794_03940, partial [Betaproteobacteria bacterium]